MITTKSTSMHSEHQYWESEISLWRDDLRIWQQEISKVQGELKHFEQALIGQLRETRLHASALRLEEQTVAGHEHAMADYEKGGEGDELFEMARQHCTASVMHQRHRARHEQLKRRQHKIIAQWNVLLKSLCEAENCQDQQVQYCSS